MLPKKITFIKSILNKNITKRNAFNSLKIIPE